MSDMCGDAGFVSDDLIVEMISEDQGSFLDMPRPYMNKEEIYYMYNNFARLFRENTVQRDRIGEGKIGQLTA